MGKTAELPSSNSAPSGLTTPEDWLRVSAPSPFITLDKDQIHQTLAESEALSVPATLKRDAVLWPEVFTLSLAIVLAQYGGSNAVELDIDAINSTTDTPIQQSIIIPAGPDNSIQEMLDTVQKAQRNLNPPAAKILPGQQNIDLQAFSTARVSLVMAETQSERDILTSDLEDEELLRVVVVPGAHGSRQFCHAQYSSAIDPKLGSRFLYQFVHIARQIVSHPAGYTVQQLEMLTTDDRVTLRRWAAASFPPISTCFHHLVAAHAELQPSTPAVSAWDGELSYAELDALSGRVASRLIQGQLPKGTIVPLLFEKSKWMVVSILAVHKAGGACVGLCTSHPDSYLRSILEQTGASRILSSAAQARRLEGLGYTSWAVPQIFEQPFESAYDDANSRPTTVASDAQDLAYVIFTSGSTGKPKGVLLTHEAISTSAYYHGLAVNVQPTSRILQFSSYAFDMSVIETWYALARGGCLCIPSETQRLWHLPAFIAEHRASWAFFTPTLLRGYHPTDLSALDTIVLGGENVTRDLARRWESHVRLFDLWGPAESAGAAGCEIVRDQWISGTFGRGAGCTLWIVQPGDVDQLAAIGTVGEVVIEGHIVAQGYLHDPVRTAQAFIPPPAWRSQFSHPVQGRFYMTGDLGQYNPDGTVRYVSRKDTVVKINGQRVDLDAVETAIRAILPERQVAVDAVVLQGRSGRTDPALLAFLQTPVGADWDEAVGPESLPRIDDPTTCSNEGDWLGRHLRQALPRFMVPLFFIPIVQLPYGATGKVDKKRLRAPLTGLSHAALGTWLYERPASPSSSSSSSSDYPTPLETPSDPELPATGPKRVLVDTVKAVLGIASNAAELDMNRSFQQLGGDSISAIQLVRALADQGITLHLEGIMSGDWSLAELACSVQTASPETVSFPKPFSLLPADMDEALMMAWIESAAQQCQVAATEIKDMYPCTPLQEGLLSYSSGVASGAYIDHFTFHLPPGISVDQVKAAWVQAVRQLGILRTRIVHSPSGQAYQVVVREEEVPWIEHASTDSFQSPDLGLGMGFGTPLVRLHCIKGQTKEAVANEGERSMLGVTLHHAIYDGWTFALLVRLVEQAYCGVKDNRPPLPFSLFVQHLQTPPTGESDTDSKHRMATFWREEMVDIQPCAYPEYPSPDYSPRAMASVRKVIAPLRATAPSSACSSSPTLRLRLGWALLLSLYSGTEDVVFGTVVDGRRANLQGIETIAGPTLSTLPVRVRLPREATVEETLRDMHDSMTRMVPFEHSGLQHIARAGPDAAQASRFRTMLVVQSDPDARESPVLGNIEVRLASMQGFSGYGLVLICHPDSGGCAIELLVDEKLVSLVQAERMLDQLAHLLHELGQQEGGRRLQEVNLLSPTDHVQLSAWLRELPTGEARCVHHLIGEVVAAKPQKTAICAWDGDLTYAELDELSTAVAKDLQAQDPHLAPGEGVVCLLFPRSRWAPVAMLAAMKAGRPFVMLDREQSLNHHQQVCKKVQPTRILAAEETRTQAQGLVDSVYLVEQHRVHSTSTCIQEAPLDPVDQSLPSGPTSSDIAYIVFTSGSTGEPKGVMIEHGQFSSAAIAQQQHLHINADSRVLHLSSYSFDSFAVEIITALCSGASVCIPSDTQSRHEIAAAVQDFAATWMVMTPSMLRLLDPNEVPSLRTLVAVGESMLPSQAMKWASHVQLICGYGPTECCTGASAQPILAHPHRGDEVMVDIRNIGSGMGAHLWLTHPDDFNRLVPIGAVGEILIQGPIVGRGYLHNLDKTREVFIDTTGWVRSLSNTPDYRLYRTGDLGRYNDDGSCTFLGRKTDQVKLNGQRLDLPTVENCLRHALGSNCTVLAAVIRPTGSNSHPVLVAMVHLGEDDAAGEASAPAVHDSTSHPFRCPHSATFTRTTLRAQAALHQSLPPVMVPSLFLQLPALPLLASGKANRPALQRAAATLTNQELAMLGRLNPETNEERLRSPDEESIAWTLSEWVAELSSKDPAAPDNRIIGRNVTLAWQGLDSIDMVALARRIAREYHLTIPATVLFQSTVTMRTIAEMIRAQDVQLHARTTPWQDYQRLVAALAQLPVLDSTASSHLSPVHGRRVFLTGGTGFLGTRILQQLVTNPEVQSVTVLVRDNNERSALARLIQAARHAQWWRDEYRRVVHVWVGDLRQPQLGLPDAQWRVLCGHAACPSVPGIGSSFDTIIHNGAVVHWVRDYEALQPSNVQSTFELLRAASTNTNVTRFLYVSALRPGEDHLPAATAPSDEMVRALLSTEKVGYSQTKLVSELVIQQYALLLLQRARRPTLRLAVVRPGLMMGAVTDGVAHLDDVIWRTVSAALAIGGYNAEEADTWLYIAPVDWVAAAVVQEALLRPCAALDEDTPDPVGGQQQQQLQPISILDGLRVRDFWCAISYATGASLRAMSAPDWLVGMQESIQSVGEQHPLWPVVEFLEATAGSIGSKPRDGVPSLPRAGYAIYSILWQTVARNIRYLSSVGYWDSGIDRSALVAGNVFRRG